MIKQSEKFPILRRVYEKLVFSDWRCQWVDGRLRVEFDYQLVIDEEKLSALKQELATNSVTLNSATKTDLLEWLNGLTAKSFTHRLEFGLKNGELIKQDNLDGLIFQIGVVEAINYWKLACPAEVEIKCGQLAPPMQDFWRKLFYKGLGEFIYLNQLHLSEAAEFRLTADNIVKFTTISDIVYSKISVIRQGNLIPVGGGKDSVVTLEVLRDQRADNLPVVMSASQAAYDCIEAAGYDNYLEIKRQLDPQVVELNRAGFLNGHVPFSAILAFITTLGAVLTGKQYIALSNESSANEPSVPGTDFNHQYSKSWEFEADFRAYLKQFVVDGVEYFSLLRPLEELEITALFSRYSQYHPVFRSCNVGKKTNSWCGHCPKCLFVFIMLAAFLDYQQVVAIFGRDVLDDINLLKEFRELIGLEETKPFECVGTVSEVRRAMRMLVAKNQSSFKNWPKLVNKFIEYDPGEVEMKHQVDHFIPESILVALQAERNRYGL